MKETITNLINDWRLDYLKDSPEFFRVGWKLEDMLVIIAVGGQLNDEDCEYVAKVCKCIENIDPHWELGYVNGQIVPYKRVIKNGKVNVAAIHS